MPLAQYTLPHRSNAVSKVTTEVHNILRQLGLSPATPTTIVLAVSGGPDSLCMVDVMLTLRSVTGIQPVIAHLNHQLRGAAAQADADFVSSFAAAHDVPCIVEHVDVAALAQASRHSVEVAARTARYRFLAAAAGRNSAPFIAVAHNADDQAETVLLRILRGTGIKGLQGMQPVGPLPIEGWRDENTIRVVRPLLGFSRQDITLYCLERGLAPRHDDSNDETRYTRNRIRLELLPILENYNPGIRALLVRLAETARTDMQIIEYATRQAYESVLAGEAPRELTFHRKAWRELPTGLQRAVLREAVRRMQGDMANLKFAAVEEARDVLNSSARSGEIAILGDMRIVVSADVFSFQWVTTH